LKDRFTTKTVLFSGLLLLGIELSLLLGIFYSNIDLALKILSMVSACHIGGRLAFISTGFELGLDVLTVTTIVMLYNTAYLLVVYSLFVLFSEQTTKLKCIRSLHDRVQQSMSFRSNWNLLSIAVFIWIPLPMTGAVIGSLVAYLEGYDHRQVLWTAVPSMWIGVVSWTLAFDKLHCFIGLINPNATLVLTLVLIGLPLIYNLVRKKINALIVKREVP
jgi:uncharacterized membrane protein